MGEELKPCPFCGGKAIKLSALAYTRVFVSCSQCECQTPMQFTYDEAKKIWNNRVLNTLTPAQEHAELQNIKKVSDTAKELLQILRLWEDLQGIENNTVFRASDGLLKIREILRRVKIIFDNAVKEIKQLCSSQEVRS